MFATEEMIDAARTALLNAEANGYNPADVPLDQLTIDLMTYDKTFEDEPYELVYQILQDVLADR